MNAKQIIRVEHEDGWGMFRSLGPDREQRPYCIEAIMPQIVDRHSMFRSPWEDGLEFTKGEDFCGYKSIEHIQDWITPDEFGVLFKNGYKIYLIEVTEFREGRDNVVYRKQDIILKKDISSLFKIIEK